MTWLYIVFLSVTSGGFVPWEYELQVRIADGDWHTIGFCATAKCKSVGNRIIFDPNLGLPLGTEICWRTS